MAPKKKSKNRSLAVVLTSLSLSGGTSIVFDLLSKNQKNASMTILLPNKEALKHGNDFAGVIRANNIKVGFLSTDQGFYDLVLLTFWTTVPMTLRSNIVSREFLFLCQSLEDRFYADPKHTLTLEIEAVQEVYRLNLNTITEAQWIKEVLDLRRQRSNATKLYSNPILMEFNDKKEKSFLKGVIQNKLVVVIEGHSTWFKGVNTAFKAISEVKDVDIVLHVVGASHKYPTFGRNVELVSHDVMTRKSFQELLSKSDCIIKLSHVEGMYGPPLEAFALGTTCITSAVTGSEEFIRHLENALIVPIGDYFGVARWLEALHKDRNLLETLNRNASLTATNWVTQRTDGAFHQELKTLLASRANHLTLSKYTECQKNYWEKLVPLERSFLKRFGEFRILVAISWNYWKRGEFIVWLRKTRAYLSSKFV